MTTNTCKFDACKAGWLNCGAKLCCGLTQGLNGLQPAAALFARLYLAQVFLLSGLTKLRDWDTTIALFTDEYHVPLLSPAAAAFLGTSVELVLPTLLLLGVGGRFAALGLFVFNIVAAMSLADIAPAALQQHVFWGSLLAGLAIYSTGHWSFDHLLCRKSCTQANETPR